MTNRGTGIVYVSGLWGVAGVQAGNLFEHYYYAVWRPIETRNNAG